MKSIKVYKIMECEVPVWENDVMTDVKEPRTLVVFVREVVALHGLATTAQFGSLLLNKGVTVEQATNSLTQEDYSEEVDFLPKPDSKFFKAVLR